MAVFFDGWTDVIHLGAGKRSYNYLLAFTPERITKRTCEPPIATLQYHYSGSQRSWIRLPLNGYLHIRAAISIPSILSGVINTIRHPSSYHIRT